MIGKDAEWGDFPNVVPALNAEVTSHPRLEHTRAPATLFHTHRQLRLALLCAALCVARQSSKQSEGPFQSR